MERIPMWLGIGAVTAGVSAAALAGAAVAGAATEDGSDPPAATSSEQSTAGAETAPDAEPEREPEPDADEEEPADEVVADDEDELTEEEPADDETVEQEPADGIEPAKEPEEPAPLIDAEAEGDNAEDDDAEYGDPAITIAVTSRRSDEQQPEPAPEPEPVVRELTAPPVPSAAPVAPLPSPFPFLDQLPPVAKAFGSLTFDILGAAIKVFTGPPQLPPGSTVTVRTSTLEIADGHRVTADWYFPAGDEPPERMIYLQHGFLAIGPMYSYTAAYLAEHTNSVVVAPTLTSNPFVADGVWLGGDPMYRAVADLFTGDREALNASAIASGYTDRYGETATLPDDFVLVGHSLGGGFVAGVSGYYARAVRLEGEDNHLVGVISLDGVPPRNDIVRNSLEELDASGTYVPFLELHAPTNYLNSTSNITQALAAGRAGKFHGVVLNGGVHMDSMLGGNPVIQIAAYLVAGIPKPQNPPAAQRLMAGWINDMFADRIDPTTGACAGTDCEGVYGPAGSTVTIPTGKGPATATVLGRPAATLREIVPASLWRPTRAVLLPVA